MVTECVSCDCFVAFVMLLKIEIPHLDILHKYSAIYIYCTTVQYGIYCTVGAFDPPTHYATNIYIRSPNVVCVYHKNVPVS